MVSTLLVVASLPIIAFLVIRWLSVLFAVDEFSRSIDDEF